MPQLDVTTFFSQLFWLGICFLSLYVILTTMALPKVARLLTLRAETVEKKLEKASLYREQAEGLLNEYEEGLAHARMEAQERYASAAHAISSEIADQKKLYIDKKSHLLHLEREKLYRAHQEAYGQVRSLKDELAKEILEKLGRRLSSKGEA